MNGCDLNHRGGALGFVKVFSPSWNLAMCSRLAPGRWGLVNGNINFPPNVERGIPNSGAVMRRVGQGNSPAVIETDWGPRKGGLKDKGGRHLPICLQNCVL